MLKTLTTADAVMEEIAAKAAGRLLSVQAAASVVVVLQYFFDQLHLRRLGFSASAVAYCDALSESAAALCAATSKAFASCILPAAYTATPASACLTAKDVGSSLGGICCSSGGGI